MPQIDWLHGAKIVDGKYYNFSTLIAKSLKKNTTLRTSYGHI